MELGPGRRTALVLGGGGGLGGAIATTLAREGAAIAVVYIDREAARARASDITGQGGRAFPLQWDLYDLSVIPERVDAVGATLGPVDILIGITGGPPPTPTSGQSPALWTKHFGAMVLSVIAITDHLLPGTRHRGWGRIITSTSSGVVAPIPNLGLSNALRLSLLGWSKTLARAVAKDGVTANVLVSGRIDTACVRSLDEQKAKREERSPTDVSAESAASISMGRYGDPQEYAEVATFLASDRASYVTGTVVRVDGRLI